MLNLDSPYWSELSHAFGSATDIPALLLQLYALPDANGEDEPWFSIWSALAHQGDVYTASFAAVPHVIEALSKSPETAGAVYFQFPVWVEICRQKHHIPVPPELELAYFAALARLPELILCAATREWDAEFTQCALSALSIAKGHVLLAEAIQELSPDVLLDFTNWLDHR